MSYRFSTLCLLLVLSGCSMAHTTELDAGGPPDDAAPMADASSPSADAATPTRCEPRVSSSVGEPCFCEGPAARRGEFVYRQAVGIEVWDTSDPSELRQVGFVDERAASTGGLMIVREHLVSVRNIEPALSVYDLSDPRAPRERSSLSLEALGGSNIRAIAAGEIVLLAVAGPELDSRVVRMDLSDLDAPRIAWEAPVDARVLSLASDGERVFAVTQPAFSGAVSLEEFDLGSGAPIASHSLADAEAGWYSVGLAMLAGHVLVGAPGELRVLDVTRASLRVVSSLSLEDGVVTGLAVQETLVLTSGAAFHVVDLADPARPRDLGSASIGGSDHAQVLADGGDVAFVSDGGGLRAVRLSCE